MQRKIALEEHFAIPDTVSHSEYCFTPGAPTPLRAKLSDIHEKRLIEMDEYGIDVMLLSMNPPGIQAVLDTAEAIELAHRANDFLAEQVAKNPDRFAAFAALPLQDPDAAARELIRCIQELGFKGALVNGFSQIGKTDSIAYYDLPQYWPFWATVEKLGIPVYLHPREPLITQQLIYDGHPWFPGAAWGFGVETATHALRLIGSALFDEYPNLTIILGHLGEGLPSSIWRVDHRVNKIPRGIKTKKRIAEYFRNNFYITTSGNLCTHTLIGSILEIGADRILFSVDYPFEEMSEAADWLEKVSISEADRRKIAYTNAERLFNLDAKKAIGARS